MVRGSSHYVVFGLRSGVPCLGPLSGSVWSQRASPRLYDWYSARIPRLRAFPLPRVTGRGAGFDSGCSPVHITDMHPPFLGSAPTIIITTRVQVHPASTGSISGVRQSPYTARPIFVLSKENSPAFFSQDPDQSASS